MYTDSDIVSIAGGSVAMLKCQQAIYYRTGVCVWVFGWVVGGGHVQLITVDMDWTHRYMTAVKGKPRPNNNNDSWFDLDSL